MGDEQQGRWVDEPPLPELTDPKPPPPADLIVVHGAQLVRIINIDDPDPRRRRGFTEALFIAWAPLTGGDWAVLTAWLSAWQTGVRTTGGGRYAWLRLTEDDVARGRIREVKPHLFDDEDEWHGHHPLHDVSIAFHAAVATLPEKLRERALRPRET